MTRASRPGRAESTDAGRDPARVLGGGSPIEPVRQVALPRIRPARGWYWLGASVAAVGLLGAFLLLTMGAFGYLGEIDDLERMAVPGEGVVELSSGELTVYHEPEGGPVAGLGRLGLAIRPLGDAGPELELEPASADRYDIEGRFGVPVATVDVDAPGSYRVVADGPVTGRLAIGRSPGGLLRTYGVAALVVALGSTVVGVVVVVVTRRRRRASTTARMRAVQAGP